MCIRDSDWGAGRFSRRWIGVRVLSKDCSWNCFAISSRFVGSIVFWRCWSQLRVEGSFPLRIIGGNRRNVADSVFALHVSNRRVRSRHARRVNRWTVGRPRCGLGAVSPRWTLDGQASISRSNVAGLVCDGDPNVQFLHCRFWPEGKLIDVDTCLLYTSPSPRDRG